MIYDDSSTDTSFFYKENQTLQNFKADSSKLLKKFHRLFKSVSDELYSSSIDSKNQNLNNIPSLFNKLISIKNDLLPVYEEIIDEFKSMTSFSSVVPHEYIYSASRYLKYIYQNINFISFIHYELFFDEIMLVLNGEPKHKFQQLEESRELSINLKRKLNVYARQLNCILIGKHLKNNHPPGIIILQDILAWLLLQKDELINSRKNVAKYLRNKIYSPDSLSIISENNLTILSDTLKKDVFDYETVDELLECLTEIESYSHSENKQLLKLCSDTVLSIKKRYVLLTEYIHIGSKMIGLQKDVGLSKISINIANNQIFHDSYHNFNSNHGSSYRLGLEMKIAIELINSLHKLINESYRHAQYEIPYHLIEARTIIDKLKISNIILQNSLESNNFSQQINNTTKAINMAYKTFGDAVKSEHAWLFTLSYNLNNFLNGKPKNSIHLHNKILQELKLTRCFLAKYENMGHEEALSDPEKQQLLNCINLTYEIETKNNYAISLLQTHAIGIVNSIISKYKSK